MRRLKPKVNLVGALDLGRYHTSKQFPYGTLIAKPNLVALQANHLANPNSSIPDDLGNGIRWSLSGWGPNTTSVVGDAIRMIYPAPELDGGPYCFIAIGNLPSNLLDVYVEFWAKFSVARHGVKFFKLHGIPDPVINGHYANTTYGLRNDGEFGQISFGDGSGIGNDTQNTIELDGNYPQGLGRSYTGVNGSAPSTATGGTTTTLNTILNLPNNCVGVPITVISGAGAGYSGTIQQNTLGPNSVITVNIPSGVAFNNTTVFRLDGAVIERIKGVFTPTDWGLDTYHRFRIHQKFNDGTTAQNAIPNGRSYLEIDGEVYADVRGLFNRHYSNRSLEWLSFGDWAQARGQTVTGPFTLWVKDIKISTGGFQP